MARKLRVLWGLEYTERADQIGLNFGHWPEIIGIWCLERLFGAKFPKNESRSPQIDWRGRAQVFLEGGSLPCTFPTEGGA